MSWKNTTIIALAGVVVAGCGTVPLALSWWLRHSDGDFLNRAVSTSGVVTALVVDDRSSIARPVVRYYNQQNQPTTFTSPFGTYPPRYTVGQTVEVLYDPKVTSDVRLRADIDQLPGEWQSMGWTMIGVGVAITTGTLLAEGMGWYK